MRTMSLRRSPPPSVDHTGCDQSRISLAPYWVRARMSSNLSPLSTKRREPVTSSYATAPRAKTSALPSYHSSLVTSGAAYPGVPTQSIESPSHQESPQSPRKTRAPGSVPRIKRLSGLMSRCMPPCAWTLMRVPTTSLVG